MRYALKYNTKAHSLNNLLNAIYNIRDNLHTKYYNYFKI